MKLSCGCEFSAVDDTMTWCPLHANATRIVGLLDTLLIAKENGNLHLLRDDNSWWRAARNAVTESRAEPAEPVHPRYCPKCGSREVVYTEDWFAHSLEEQDMQNCGKVFEYQCRNNSCCTSFWMPDGPK